MSDRPEALGFLQDIRDHPDDNELRLIFADWLEEQGDPRGAFVRVQVELARLTEVEPGYAVRKRREAELLRQYGKAWLAPFGELAARVEFVRGLARLDFRRPASLDEAPALPPGPLPDVPWLGEVAAEVWFDHQERPLLERLAPGLTDLALSASWRVPPAEARWGPALDLPRVRALSLNARPSANFGLGSLLAAVRATPRRVRVSGASLDQEDREAAAAWAALPGLTELTLASCERGDGGAIALLGLPNLGPLERLTLSGCGLTADGCRALAGCPRLARLRSLDLSSNDLGADALSGLRALAAPWCDTLEELTLGHSPVGPAGAAALAAIAAPNLRRLDLSYSGLDVEAARALAGARGLPRLEVLSLRGNAVTDEGAAALAPHDARPVAQPRRRRRTGGPHRRAGPAGPPRAAARRGPRHRPRGRAGRRPAVAAAAGSAAAAAQRPDRRRLRPPAALAAVPRPGRDQPQPA
jgi:uncharacterized protein (TIGR02996 family)